MNTRRWLLGLFGLGSLATTAGAVTINQARAARGMGSIPPNPAQTMWKHRIVRVDPLAHPEWPTKHSDQITEEILDRLATDGWELVSIDQSGLRKQMLFRKRVSVTNI